MRVFLIVTVVFMFMFVAVFEWAQTTFITNHELAHAQNCKYMGGTPEVVTSGTDREMINYVVCDIETEEQTYDFDGINESIGYQLIPILYSTFLYGFIILMYMGTIAGVLQINGGD